MKLTSRTIPDLVIEDIKKVTVQPNDIIVIHLDTNFSQMTSAEINTVTTACRNAAQSLFPNNKIVVFDRNTQISVVTLAP